MLEIKMTALAFCEEELIKLEGIITDRDERAALVFLKKVVYDRLAGSQQGRLKSHLDSGGDPVDMFKTGPAQNGGTQACA